MLRVRSVSTGVAGAPYYTNVYFNGSVSEAVGARTRMVNFWNDLVPVMRTGLQTQVEQEVWEIDPATGDTIAIATAGTGTPATGTGAGAALPPATQALLRLGTNVVRRNRRVAGKIFIPGMTVTNSLDGRPANSLITALNTAAGRLTSGVITDRVVVWSRPNVLIGPVGLPGLSCNVSATSVWNEFAVLRSRRD